MPPPWKFTDEDRQGEEVDSRLLSMSADRVFTDELSVGTEGRIYTEKSAMGGRQSEHELKASIAYRPLDARFAVLDQITARYESNDTSSVFTAVNSVYYSRRLQNGHEVNLRHGIKYTDASFGKDEASMVICFPNIPQISIKGSKKQIAKIDKMNTKNSKNILKKKK